MKWEDDQEEYRDNPTGSTNAGHECFFDDKTIRQDVKSYREVPLEGEEPGQTEVVVEMQMIDMPDVSPHEFFHDVRATEQSWSDSWMSESSEQ